MSRGDMVEIVGTFVHATPAAILVEVEGDDQWFPRAKIAWDEGAAVRGEEIGVSVPWWMAEARGLVAKTGGKMRHAGVPS